jgi:hypothetical protein
VIRSANRFLTAAALTLALSSPLFAQDDPAVLKPAEPDFTLVALPTSLRLPTMKSAFRVTHRFTRSLGDGDFGDLAGDLFGIDSSAQIGLEYRFGIIPNGQIGIHRTNDRTIELFSEYAALRQEQHAFDVSALVAIEGADNFSESFSPTLGAVVSRKFAERGALYLEPMWVNNSNPAPKELVDHNDSFLVGIGGRLRVRPTVYVVGEVIPRVAGYAPGAHQGSIALEKRAGGHVFQLNFSTGIGTTPAQIARGGTTIDNWYLGFNISRKFF